MGRAPCCDKSKVKRGPWSPEEDAVLKRYVNQNGVVGNWISLPHKAGLRRCGKSCRLRWLNYLRPDIRHGNFTEEEDNIIIDMYSRMGSKWSIIASTLDKRTDNDVKNYWNTKLKKRYEAMKSNQGGGGRARGGRGNRGGGGTTVQQNSAQPATLKRVTTNSATVNTATVPVPVSYAPIPANYQPANYQPANYQPAAVPRQAGYFPTCDLASFQASLYKAQQQYQQQYPMPPYPNNLAACPIPIQQPPLFDPIFGYVTHQQIPTTTTTTAFPMPPPSFPDLSRISAGACFGSGQMGGGGYMVNPTASLDAMSGGSSSSLTFDHGSTSSGGYGGSVGGGNPWMLEEEVLLSDAGYSSGDYLMHLMSNSGNMAVAAAAFGAGFGGSPGASSSVGLMGDVKPSQVCHGANYT